MESELGTDRAGRDRRVRGIEAMRALAHPTRVRIKHMLATEPLSASELARRLDIRVGSAQFHLRTLVRAGIAVPAGERTRRGGRELLFRVPPGTGVELARDASPELRGQLYAAYVAELQRLLDASRQVRPGAEDHTITTIREIRLTADTMPAARAAVEELLVKLGALDDEQSDGAEPTVLSLFFFPIPTDASRR